MGKKARLKQIRKIASQLPVIKIPVVKGSIVDTDNGLMRKKELGEAFVNHNRRMKSFYNQYGVMGVVGYVNSVKRFVNQATKK